MLSQAERDHLKEFNSEFARALRESGFRAGEEVNVLLNGEVAHSELSNMRSLLQARGLLSIDERTKGLIRKKIVFEARTVNFPYDEAVLVEWNEWAFKTFKTTGISISVGVCQAG